MADDRTEPTDFLMTMNNSQAALGQTRILSKEPPSDMMISAPPPVNYGQVVLTLGEGDSNLSEDEEVNTGRWTTKEHEAFLVGYEKFGKDWKRISEFIGTRSNVQCRTHAQKFFKKRVLSGHNSDSLSEDGQERSKKQHLMDAKSRIDPAKAVDVPFPSKLKGEAVDRYSQARHAELSSRMQLPRIVQPVPLMPQSQPIAARFLQPYSLQQNLVAPMLTMPTMVSFPGQGYHNLAHPSFGFPMPMSQARFVWPQLPSGLPTSMPYPGMLQPSSQQ